MDAKESLRRQLKETADQDLERFETLMEDALPRAYRASQTLRLIEGVQPLSVRMVWEIDDLTDSEAQEILDYLDWANAEFDTASDEEIAEADKGQAEIKDGRYITLDELKRKLGS